MTGSVTDLDPALSILHASGGSPAQGDPATQPSAQDHSAAADLEPANVSLDPLVDTPSSAESVDDELSAATDEPGSPNGRPATDLADGEAPQAAGIGARTERFTPPVPTTDVPDLGEASPLPPASSFFAGPELRLLLDRVGAALRPRRRIGLAALVLLLAAAALGSARKPVRMPSKPSAAERTESAPAGHRAKGRRSRPEHRASAPTRARPAADQPRSAAPAHAYRGPTATARASHGSPESKPAPVLPRVIPRPAPKVAPSGPSEFRP
jgi:hypothetical protein